MANWDKSLIPASWKYRIRCARMEVVTHSIPVWILALLGHAAGRLARPFRPAVSLIILSKAHTWLLSVWGRSRGIRWLNRKIEMDLAKACRTPGLIESTKLAPERGVFQFSQRVGIVLKAARLESGRVLERGVLLLKHSDLIGVFRRQVDMEALLPHYHLVLEPSWTGYASLGILAYTRYREHSIVLLAPFRGDREFLERLGSNLSPIELGPGDWVDPSVFRPLDGEPKVYDAAMIARWDFTKRHDLMLRALRQIAVPRVRVAFVSKNWTEELDRKGVMSAIESSGLRQQIDILEDLAPAEVNRVLNQSKVNVLLSSREGGNRCLFEGFFAGVPGLAFRNHIGVRTEHFVPETGRLIERDALAAELLYFRDHWGQFNPRPWALSHISPEISTQRLNEFLKLRSLKRGEPWTKNIVMKCNRPICGTTRTTVPVKACPRSKIFSPNSARDALPGLAREPSIWKSDRREFAASGCGRPGLGWRPIGIVSEKPANDTLDTGETPPRVR